MERLTRWIDDTKDVAIEGKEATKDECLKRLADYEDAEEEGKLAIFPIAIGDRIWVIQTVFGISTIYGYVVTSLSIMGSHRTICAGVFANERTNGDYFDLADMGEKIFTSSAEAEAKLKEMEDDND